MPGGEIIGGGANSGIIGFGSSAPVMLVPNGVLTAATGVVDITPPQMANLSYLRLDAQLDAFNGGALCQLAVRWNGPAIGGYKQGGYWSSGASGAASPAIANLGTYGGAGVLVDQDQLNVAAPRLIVVEFFKRTKAIRAEGTVFDVAGSAAFATKINGLTTDATAITGISLLLGGNTVTGTYTITGY